MNCAIVVAPLRDGYEGFAPDFPWCFYQGQTAEAALQETVNAIEFHLNGLLEDGDPIPQPTAVVADVQVQLPMTIDSAKTTSYRVVIEQAPKNFSAFVPDLPGCISTGDTMQEMLSMIKEAMECHIEIMIEFGDPIPPKTSIVEMIEMNISNPASVAD